MSAKSSNFTFQKYLIALVLLGFGGMIGYFYLTNKLVFFVYPRYESLVIGSAVLLLALGIYTTLVSTRNLQKMGLFAHISVWSAALLLIPILLGLGIPPTPLSTQTASMRGVNTDMSMVYASAGDVSFVFDPEKRSFRDWIGLLAIDPEPSHHAGQRVNIEGVILFDEALPENAVYLTRFQIACCAADARPIALPVVFDPKKFSFQDVADDQWIRIRGVWEEGEIEGVRKAVIQLEEFEEIEVPKNPYLY